MQIDLLNEMARFTTIHLPIHALCGRKIKKSDWLLWLLSEKEISLAVLRHESTRKKISKRSKAEVSFFNKNRLGEKLSSLNIKDDATLIMPGADKGFWLNNEYHGVIFNFLRVFLLKK